jgi:hypothetical protein
LSARKWWHLNTLSDACSATVGRIQLIAALASLAFENVARLEWSNPVSSSAFQFFAQHLQFQPFLFHPPEIGA